MVNVEVTRDVEVVVVAVAVEVAMTATAALDLRKFSTQQIIMS